MLTEIRLNVFLDKMHARYQLVNRLNWAYLRKELSTYYTEGPSRAEIPIRVMAGPHDLNYLGNESDESVIEQFCKIPCEPYLCGVETFAHTCHPTTRVKWRKRFGEKDIEKLLRPTREVAKSKTRVTRKTIKQGVQ